MVSFGIIGSGFGLYGYLPAILSTNKRQVYILKRYKEILKNRKELNFYESKVKYLDNEQEILKNSDIIILARRPIDNEKLFFQIENKKVIIEKPIAKSPNEAFRILLHGNSNNIKIYSGFLFEYQNWYEKITNITNGTVNIRWGIKKVNTPDSWKYAPKNGGGLTAFYAIHLINLATQNDFQLNNSKLLNLNNLSLNFNKKGVNLKCNLYFSNSPIFSICLEDKHIILQSGSPFGERSNNNERDFRVNSLEQLIKNVISKEPFQKIFETIELWDEVERNILK